SAALGGEVRVLLCRFGPLDRHAVGTLAATAPAPAAAVDAPAEEVARPEPALQAPPEPTGPVAPAEPAAPASPPAVHPPEPSPATAIDLEQRIGARWTIWIGAVAILFGIAFFLKWSFENDLLGPVSRVLLGLIAGAGLVASGLLLHRRRAMAHLSEGLTGLGLGVLYLALFGAHAVYGLLNAGAALGAMAVVTLVGALAAVATNRQVIAVLAVLGGLLTPSLLTVAEPDERNLLAYLLVLDLLAL